MDDRDDQALERVRAADPAIGSHPDLTTLRRTLSRSAPVQDPDGAFGYGEGSDVAVRVADPTTRGSRVALVAAAAVMALGLGVGGYALGTQTVEGGDGTAAPSVTDEAETDPVADGPDADGPDAEDPESAQGSLLDLLRDEVSAGSGAASESMASGGYAMGGA
ncbi:MAG: hypothetical protein M3519_03160, partial [Actinomycetota bacterium]|nr:hypothetical protein [Actinomycetota bacterium]